MMIIIQYQEENVLICNYHKSKEKKHFKFL